MYTVMK